VKNSLAQQKLGKTEVLKKKRTKNKFGEGTRKVKLSFGTGRKHGKMKSSVKGTAVKFVSTRVSTIYGGIWVLYPGILTSTLESSK
jgi:hypothetical protein